MSFTVIIYLGLRNGMIWLVNRGHVTTPHHAATCNKRWSELGYFPVQQSVYGVMRLSAMRTTLCICRGMPVGHVGTWLSASRVAGCSPSPRWALSQSTRSPPLPWQRTMERPSNSTPQSLFTTTQHLYWIHVRSLLHVYRFYTHTYTHTYTCYTHICSDLLAHIFPAAYYHRPQSWEPCSPPPVTMVTQASGAFSRWKRTRFGGDK